jgi:DNA repair protein RadC
MAVLMAALPVHERPRERLLARGAEALTERELLALVLRNGTNGISVLDLAAGLLADYGSLDALAMARPEELAVRPGFGPAKAASVVAALRLGRRLNAPRSPRPVLRRPEDVAAIAIGELGAARQERVLVIICDAANRILQATIVSEGSVDRSLMPIREILNAVLRHDGRAFAVAHNHPDGTTEASDADQRATNDLKAAARVVGLRFLGHIVVAESAWRAVS